MAMRPTINIEPNRLIADGRSLSAVTVEFDQPAPKRVRITVSSGSIGVEGSVKSLDLPVEEGQVSFAIRSAKRPGVCRLRIEPVGEDGRPTELLSSTLTFYPSVVQALVFDWIPTILFAVIIAIVLRAYVFAAYKIPSPSMEPTLLIKDRLFADKFSYVFRLEMVESGQIVIFKYPKNPRLNFIKRVIGLSGDKITIKGGKLYVNSVLREESYLNSPDSGDDFPIEGDLSLADISKNIVFPKEGDPYFLVPEHSFFVMGDNRYNSADSRSWGIVPEENIIGRAMIIYWPLSRIHIIK